MRKAIAAAAADLLDALLDRYCPGCGGALPRGGAVCATCDARVPRTGVALCLRCLHGSPSTEESPGGGCPRHGRARLLLSGPVFEPPLDLILHTFKYEGGSSLAPWIGSLLPEPPGLGDALGREYILVPVSLHPARRAWRGFDQALLLACGASARWGIPVVEAVSRTRDHEPQARLDPERRRRNVTGAFSVRCPAAVRGRPVLLVDDVATTGSTLLAAAEALETAGAEWILSLTAAHGGLPDSPNARASFELRSDRGS